MDTLTVSSFRTNLAAAFNQADAGEKVLICRNHRYYTLIPVQIESISEIEPNVTTQAAIKTARTQAQAWKNGNKDVESVDTSSVEAMLHSCGL